MSRKSRMRWFSGAAVKHFTSSTLRRVTHAGRVHIGSEVERPPDDTEGGSPGLETADPPAFPDYVVIGGWPFERQTALQTLGRIYFESRIPCMLLSQWWPEASRARADIQMDATEWWSLPYGELAVIDAIIRHLQPRTLFEFGTFTGSTTVVLADAAPEGAVIHTIDIPPYDDEEQSRAYEAISGVAPELLGSRFRHRANGKNDIVFHRSFSRDFDYEPLRGKVDFVLIDASHEYEDVIHDSRRAVEMLSPWGVIVWDDYDWAQPGVVRALADLAGELQLVQIASTRLAVHRRRG